MRRITRNKRKWKRKVSERREATKTMTAMDEINDIDSSAINQKFREVCRYTTLSMA